MRVLHVITGLAAGGAEQQLRLFLQRTRHDSEVVSLTEGGVIADEIARAGTPVAFLHMRSNRDLPALRRLTALVRAGRYDVVHAHLYRACLFGRVAARLAGVPRVVTTEHSIGTRHIEGRPMTPPVRALYLGTERLTDVTVAVSNTVRTRLIDWGVPAEKVVVIPNALDVEALAFDRDVRARTRAALGLDPDVYVIGAVGRLAPAKALDRLIAAAAPLLGPRVQLLIVGDGPERAGLAEQAHAAGLADHVRFPGERRDVTALLSAMDLLVSPSEEETFGLSILEAVANGLPVLFRQCPPLEAVGGRATAAGACQVPAGTEALRAALAARVRAGATARQAPPPDLLADCHPDTTARRIDDLYELVAPRRGLLPARRQREEHLLRAPGGPVLDTDSTEEGIHP